MKKIFLYILLLNAFNGYSQQTSFQKVYDTLGYYYTNCIRQTTDKGFIMCGSNYSTAQAQDAAIIKTDSLGNMEWIKTYGGTSTDGAITMEIINDTNYFVWCIKDEFSITQNDLWLLKLDSHGDTIFTKILSLGPGQNVPKASTRTIDNGFVLTGFTDVIGNGLQDIFLMKIDTSGNIVWTKTYGGTMGETSYDVIQSSDSGYVITGTTSSFNAAIADVYAIKTDKYGDTLWTRTFGYTNNDLGQGITETMNHEYIVAGTSYDTISTGYNILLLKYDLAGQLIWFKEYFIPLENNSIAIKTLPNGEYIIGGTTYSTIGNRYQALLMQIDDLGDSIWMKTYNLTSNSSDIPYSMLVSDDGGFVLAGKSDFPPHPNGFILKTDSIGNIISFITDIADENFPLIFPNPAVNDLTIKFPEIIKNELEFVILDITGRLVQSGKIPSGKSRFKFDVQDLHDGFYLLNMFHNNTNYSSNKFIVSHFK